MLQRNILIAPMEDGSLVGERVDLYLQSKDVIGAFW